MIEIPIHIVYKWLKTVVKYVIQRMLRFTTANIIERYFVFICFVSNVFITGDKYTSDNAMNNVSIKYNAKNLSVGVFGITDNKPKPNAQRKNAIDNFIKVLL